MDVVDDTYTLGPESGRLLVRTARTGLGAKAGHDLTIEVGRWRGRAVIDAANPAGSSVTVTIEVDSFEVRDGTGGVKPLTDSDRAEIRRIIQEKILRTAQYPTISFRSTKVNGSSEAFEAAGDLTIVGVTKPVTVQGRLVNDRVEGWASVVQTRWAIKPYSAFLGALKLRDEVRVEFDLALRREDVGSSG